MRNRVLASTRTSPLTGRIKAWLRADRPRYWAAFCLSVLLTLVGVVSVLLPSTLDPTGASFVTGVYFAAWILFCVLYSGLTWCALRLADGPTLATWLRENDRQRRSRRRSELLYGTGGPAGAVALCAIALVAVLVTAALPELRDHPASLALAVAVVATTWCLLVVVYALHYARESTRAGGLTFPGQTEGDVPVFADFVYLATAVATGFAAADVSIQTTAMRREVTAHALIAFAFNTVVVALLVSLLVTVGG